MHFSLYNIAIIAISTAFVTARPLSDDAMVAPDSKVEWTDLMPSGSNVDQANTGPSSYKEFEHAADQEIRQQEEQGRVNYNVKPNSNIDLNQEATEYTNSDDAVVDEKITFGDLLPNIAKKKASSDKNSTSSSTRYAFDIIMKPGESQAQTSQSDTTLMDAGTRNAFSKNEIASDTTDYANNEAIDRGNSMPVASNQDDQVLLPPVIQIEGEEDEEPEQEEESSHTDFLDALDQALLDPYISAIDSDLNSEVYEAPVTETTTFEVATNGQVPDYVSLIAEQIRSAEEQIRIKHDELIQDQQQIDDLKRKVHHSSATATTGSLAVPTFSMEAVESGPDETMYVYKHIQPATTGAVDLQQPPPPPQPDLGTSVMPPPPPPPPPSTKRPNLETDHQQELRAEQNVPSAVINNTPFYNLVQKQTDEEEDYYQTKAKKGSAPSSSVVEAVDLVIPPRMGDTTFDPSNKLKLPNGSWTPSCKNVSKGLYCLQPNGQGSVSWFMPI